MTVSRARSFIEPYLFATISEFRVKILSYLIQLFFGRVPVVISPSTIAIADFAVSTDVTR